MNTQDTDLERRLRSIGRAAPEAPASLDERAAEVTLRRRGGSVRTFDLGGRQRGMRWLAAVAATLAVVVLVGSALRIGPTDRNTAGWTPRVDAGKGQWTAIEWHDVSAGLGGMTGSGWWWPPASDLVIRWAGGYAAVGDQGWFWISEDGINWRRSTNLPQAAWLGAVGGALLVFNGMPGRGAWSTADGEKLTPISVPFDLGQISAVASGKPGLIVTTAPAGDPSSAAPPGPSTFYFTADGNGWTRATLPSDLGQARGVIVRQFIDGFIATGEVEDPASGNYRSRADDTGAILSTWHYRELAWYSPDGLRWSKFDPQGRTVDQPSSWTGVESGRLGAGNGEIHSVDGGRTWAKDDNAPFDDGTGQLYSNGLQIVHSVGGGARFYVSEGDGRWTLLKQGGDIGSLPADGAMLVQPQGILWISGNKAYFGEALSGIEPRGSIGPPITPTPGLGPSNTPAVELTATPTHP